MTYLAGDLEEALDEYGLDEDGEPLDDDSYGEGGWETVAWEWDDKKPRPVTVEGHDGPETLAVKVLEVSTGTYDDDTYVILQARDNAGEARTFRKSGYSASHDGTYFDGSFDEVESFEVTETRWRKIR